MATPLRRMMVVDGDLREANGAVPPSSAQILRYSPGVTDPPWQSVAGESRPPGINYERLYACRFSDVGQHRREAVWQEIARYMHRRMGAPERILDPAAGRGEFITAVPATERWGVDLVGHGVPESAGVRMIINDIMAADLPADYFDGVFVSNFLEHLADQHAVATVLGKLHSVLKPGGRIAVVGPNFRYCAREYFDCADHTVILSHIAVTEHLYAAGFDVNEVSARFLPYSFRGLLPPSPALTRLYLRVPALWRLLGKQFLVLASKPADQPAG